jgi:hypothetical protein
MNAHFDPKHVINPFASPIQQTLADVLAAVVASNLPRVQKRDQASAVKRIGALCRKDLGDIPADIAVLRDLVQRLDPTAVDFKPKPLSHKTWSNIRSNFLAALQIAGLAVTRTRRWPRSPRWQHFLKCFSRRYRDGLSRFAGFCTVNGIEPEDVSSSVWEAFGQVLMDSFANANMIKRDTACLWNKLVAAGPDVALERLPYTSRRRPPTRILLEEFPAAFLQDVENHLAWVELEDPYVPDARDRPLGARSHPLPHS